MAAASVVRIDSIRQHPDADRLDIISFSVPERGHPVELVTGQHYIPGTLGVWFRVGCLIPGFLAEEMWLTAKGTEWYEVAPKVMRGITSPGLFGGSVWQKTREHDIEPWSMWRKHWQEGDDVSAFFGATYGTV